MQLDHENLNAPLSALRDKLSVWVFQKPLMVALQESMSLHDLCGACQRKLRHESADDNRKTFATVHEN